MNEGNSTFIMDICKAYALAFFTTIVLGNVILEINKIINVDVLNSVGQTIINMACPVIAIAIGSYIGLSRVGAVSLFIIGAIGTSYGTPGPLVTLVIAIALSLIFHILDGPADSISIFLFPILALIVGMIGFKVLTPFVQNMYGFLISLFVRFDNAAYGGGIMNYIIIALLSGVLFVSPIGMYGIVPLLFNTSIGNSLSSNTMVAISCGVMSFMVGLAVAGLKGNNIGNTLCVALGTPTLQFGNIFHNPLLVIEPIFAASVSTVVSIKFLSLTTSATLMQYGNCVFIGMVEILKTAGVFCFIKAIAAFIIIPAVVSFVIHLGTVALSLIKDSNYTIQL